MSGTKDSIKAGVIGWPIEHSRSPAVHRFWLQAYGIDGRYDRFPVQPDALPRFLKDMQAAGIKGVNVTVPHKEAAFQLMDSADEISRRLSAVNTIEVLEDGTLRGSNTDGFGFLENLRHGAPDWQPEKTIATVLGAGGAARAVVAALQADGWNEVRVSNRTEERALKLARDLGPGISVASWEKRGIALQGAELLVNTTTLGMTGSDPLDLDLAALPDQALVNDIVYVPLKTALLSAAAARGLAIVDGLGMLLHQARPGFKAWFGIDPEVTEAQRKYVLEADL